MPNELNNPTIGVLVDGPLISSRHPGDLPMFCQALIAQLN